MRSTLSTQLAPFGHIPIVNKDSKVWTPGSQLVPPVVERYGTDRAEREQREQRAEREREQRERERERERERVRESRVR